MNTLAIAAAAVLQCVSAQGSGLKAPITTNIVPEADDLRSLQERRAPIARIRFIGEARKATEWQFASENAQIFGGIQLARVSLAQFPGNSFDMRLGVAYPKGRKTYRFEELMRGTCTLVDQIATTPEGKQ